MADSRIKDLANELLSGEIQALLDTLFLAVDETSFTDAEKVLWKNLLITTAITSNANDYQAMTPKAFYDSLQSDSIRGVGQTASDTNVTLAIGNNVLKAGSQDVMQAQWLKDWFVANNVPIIMHSNVLPLASKSAFSYTVTWKGAMSNSEIVTLQPAALNGEEWDATHCILSIVADGDFHGGSHSLANSGPPSTSTLGSTGVQLRLEGAGASLGIFNNSGGVLSNVSISMTVHGNLV